MLKLDQAVVVEGKYDKIKLSSVISSVIICTDGFRIFSDNDRMEIIRHYAKTTGIIILTDSDSAGFKIRNHIKGSLGNECRSIINVYIPDIFGKERRKHTPSKEGKLGVEGMSEQILLEAFKKAGIMPSDNHKPVGNISKMLLYELGYSGLPDSSARRKALLEHLGLPSLMTTNALADILNTMVSDEELIDITEELFKSELK